MEMTNVPRDGMLAELDEDREGRSASAEGVGTWRILVVDDDKDVHEATEFALAGTAILGRPLEFLHAFSAQEAERVLRTDGDIAVVLLDVVMERASAGLDLVRTIRGELGNSDVRIILRTGQPGYAPEVDAVREYDINDYKTKAELSHSRLYTTLTTAIRSYDQIHAINRNRRGLDRIIGGSRRLMAHQNINEFAAGAIAQVAQLIGDGAEGFACTRNAGQDGGEARIVAGTGRFAVLVEQPVSVLRESPIADALTTALRSYQHHFADDGATLYVHGKTGADLAICLATRRPLDGFERHLLEVFCANITVALGNVHLVGLLQDQAQNDQLLRIPNRLAFIQLIEEERRSGGGRKTVALIDIDHFSQINAALGHAYGDALLMAVRSRLQENLPAGCRLARIGEDTFALLGDDDQIDPRGWFEQFGRPFLVEGSEHTVSVSIGLARLGEVDGYGSDVLKAANIALKRAKDHARGEYCYFTRSMEYETRSRVKLMQELCAAFQHDRLFMVYQPQLRLDSRRVVGIEALLRWRSDNGEFVPPGEFIPIAERSGVIVALGAWVLRTACHAQVQFKQELGVDLRMAVNVSVPQFRHPDFLRTLDAILVQTGCRGESLELEITESVAMLEPEFIIRMLEHLKERGITVAIDDFGTGFSSLSYLERLPVDRLKIDRSFVGQVAQNRSSLRIAETIVSLGHSLNLGIVAEGIETEAQALELSRMGCHEGQGYLFSRPLEANALLAFMRKQLVDR